MVLAALCPLGLRAQGIADIVSALRSAPATCSEAHYSVSLPQRDNDVTYNIMLATSRDESDTLAPCDYLIDWTLDTPSGPAHGFSVYFDGHHYRCSGQRLQEYHYTWDSIPFIPTSRSEGVQRMAQFTELLPPFIADRIEEMEADSLYTVTLGGVRLFDGKQALPLRAVMTMRGQTVQELEYLFDATTLMPLRISKESNPGSITEQTVLATFTPVDNPAPIPLSEDALITRYPDEFTRMRESNFAIENLPGSLLPTFALPTSAGSRFTHHRGEKFDRPVILAIFDPATGLNSDLIALLREGIASLDRDVEMIYAFTGSDIEAAERAAGTLLPGETLLLNARGLARDCGAASLPVTVIAASDSKVKKVILGMNQNIPGIVLQTIALSD